MKKEAGHSSGFSLLELLVALGISTCVSLAGWAFYRQQAVDLRSQFESLSTADGVRGATAFIARDIRSAGYDPTGEALPAPGARGIREAGPHLLNLELDRDGDGLIDRAAAGSSAESIIYSYDDASGSVLRTAGGETHVLVRGVSAAGFAFTYLDVDGQPVPASGSPLRLDAAGKDAVAFVVLRLSVSARRPPTGPGAELTIRTAIRSRILERL